MQKKHILIAAACALFFLAPAALSQHRADRQELENSGSFSMILLGDPQGYIKYDINQPLFELCTAWIADNIEQLNIKAVLCTGDLVEQNDNIIMNRKMVNQTSCEMWESVSRAFERLDDRVPYIVSPGNHDYGLVSSEDGRTNFPVYFPFERNRTWRNTCVAALPNRNGVLSLENAAFEFTDANWGAVLVITSEFHPRNEVLEWAKKLAASDKYKDCTVLFMTHGYIKGQGGDAELIGKENYKLNPEGTGKHIWETLVKPSSNIRLVICGHEAGKADDFATNVGYRIDSNDAGRDVHQMMFNVQKLGGGWEGNGGDGWLRILEFLPDGKTIKVRTYSPLFGISPSTKHLAHRNESFDRFDIVF